LRLCLRPTRDVLIEIGIAIEIDIGSIGANSDNDFDFDGLDRAALKKLDASAKMLALNIS
jgi:hypothetical protein